MSKILFKEGFILLIRQLKMLTKTFKDLCFKVRTLAIRSFVQPHHLLILIIFLSVIFSNIYFSQVSLAQSESARRMSELDHNQIGKVIDNLDKYTPVIDEDIDAIKSEIAYNQADDYLNKNNSLATEASKLEREYIVQKGDTMSSIAKNFSLHVASLIDRNNIAIDKIESLQVGEKLIIPSYDTSSSDQWLVQLNSKKEKDRQLALKKQQDQKKKLAASNRSVVARERADGGYEGEASNGWNNPINYRYISRGIQRGHTGIDMVADIGTPIFASKAGKVIEITRGYGSGWGLSILMDNGDGQSSRYAHMSSFAVGVGDYLGQGQLLGYSGNTGWSTGPHLHFEARYNGRPFNPWR